ncbi:metallophosphoesterase family protein [Campylobacter showae]|uniref:metallophosphoesterase family protein n=1 Tax=Campylobacter showae TaxID=204 RepID=UPI003C6FE567
MKILHATDLHYNKSWFKFIKNLESNFDIVCITGDFIDAFDQTGIAPQIAYVSEWLASFNKPVFVCSGNHDVGLAYEQEWLNDIPNIYADNAVKEINGVKFGCAPYLKPDYAKFAQCDVLLSHVPPAYTKASVGYSGDDYCSEKLYNAIGKQVITPKTLLCGHIHNPIKNICRLKHTTIYNPGCDKNLKEPKIRVVEA